MNRNIMAELLEWKKMQDRKPLILRGARQVGKTTILKEFGKRYFKRVIYINLNEEQVMQNVFEGNITLEKLVFSIQTYGLTHMDTEETLIIFDEIQEAPRALLGLKLFYQEAPEYFIVAGSSVMGREVYDRRGMVNSFTEVKTIYPLSFYEFTAYLKGEELAEILASGNQVSITRHKNEYLELLRQYFYVGGMPEAVFVFKKSMDLKAVRTVHLKLLSLHETDLLENAPESLGRKANRIWKSAAQQLTKENKKFFYREINSHARGKYYEGAFNWLEECGLIYKVYRILDPVFPIEQHVKNTCFKAYYVDVGILGAALQIDPKWTLGQTQIYEVYNRALTEQFVCQELVAADHKMLYYWIAEKSIGTIAFILEDHQGLIPIDVQAVENLQAKSLKLLTNKFALGRAVRTSLSEYRKESAYSNIPLYSIMNICKKSL